MAITGLTGCKSSDKKDSDSVDTVRIGTQEMPNDEGIAKAENYLEEKMGVKVKLVKFDSGKDINNALKANSIDFGLEGSTSTALALSTGIDVKLIWIHEVLGDIESLAVRKKDNIKSIADLKGKTVSIGSSGSGVYYNAIDVLGAYGLTEDDITPTYQSFGDSVDALQDGKIDAAFVVAGAPTVAVSTLASSRDVHLVSIDDEHIDTLIASSPYYSAYTIDSSVYGTDEDCQTVAIAAVVIARDDVSDDAAYDVISTIFNDREAIAASHNKGNELDLAFASSITNVPYHPGAAAYYAEQGITVPVK